MSLSYALPAKPFRAPAIPYNRNRLAFRERAAAFIAFASSIRFSYLHHVVLSP
jgi:hypothetical protein